MHTYSELFAIREFRVVFAASTATVAGQTMQNLALSSVVFAATGSPLLAAIAFLAGFLPSAVGAMALMSYADRVRPRRYIVSLALLDAGAAAVLALADLPVWSMIAIVVAVGLVASIGSGVTGAMLNEVVGEDGFVLARSVLNITVGSMQIVGFAVGGAVIATLGTRPALLVVCALGIVTAVVARAGLRNRPPRATGRGSLRLTAQGNRALLGDRPRRSILLAGWLPNGLIVGAEALYVPYAEEHAAVLFCAGAFGMLLGDVTMGRFVPAAKRFGLVVPLRLLLAVPYLVFFLEPSVWAGAIAVVLASFGFSASLALQERLLQLTPEDLRAQALGLGSSGMVTCQALGATLIGSLAQVLSPALAMSLAAVLSIAVTLAIVPGLRRAAQATVVT